MSLEGETKFVYSVSSRKGMIEQLIISIQSLKNYVSSDNVVVFYTPPREERDLKLIENLGVEVRKRERMKLQDSAKVIGTKKATTVKKQEYAR